jgi:SH3-like domain-containing protein
MSMKLLWNCLLCAASLVAAPIAQQSAVAAQGMTTGSVTGLPTPRYVSLKSDRVNLREGPSKDHRTTWVFQRAGLPVEITAEFETWRRIRDSEGS